MNKALRTKQSPEDSNRLVNDPSKSSKVAPETLLRKEKQEQQEQREVQRDVKYVKIALANLEAALRLLTKKKIDLWTQYGVGDGRTVVYFNVELGKLIGRAKDHIHDFDNLIDYSKWQIAELRKAAA